ncbi:adenosine deaminase-like [Patiria miniata]|uniref:Adenosine deaminase n=1 Tax=Patiria miniata TaxID=46514 RepID=A0A913ZDW9_PATMI|nr:adenosine deaminase-like [Patiria miniata]
MADESKSQQLAPKVELHLHLDGAVRPSTIWELAKKRGIDVPGSTAEEMTSIIRHIELGSLPKFLEKFEIFLPPLIGDKEALRRISYELCEDKAREGVVYFETRFSPQLLVYSGPDSGHVEEKALSTREVMQSIVEGLDKGQKDFNVKARLIICTARETPGWAAECLQLCREYSPSVVGIDIADCGRADETEGHVFHPEIVRVFQEAERCGIHRTVHAGEDGPASNVKKAIELLKAERIGHGYHSVDDDDVYQMVKDKGIHLEICPTSSVYTGSCDPDFTKHPCVRFVQDKMDFSLNTDDPTVFANTINDEFQIAKKYFPLSEEQAVQATLNAARASFLPKQEKLELIQHLRAAYRLI